MMRDVYSDVIQFRGSHFDYGYMQGKRILKTPLLDNREIQWGPKKERHFRIDPDAFTHYIKKIAPGILEEIRGLSAATGLDMNEAIRLFSGYYLEYRRSGCSVMTTSEFMVRNYDSHPRSYEGRFLLFAPSDGGYATIGPSMQVTGRIDGLNEKGLAIAYNFTHRKQSDDGFLCNMIGRLILESCANITESIHLLETIPHRHSFSYILLDKSGQSIVAEASPRKVKTREANICTNHFHIMEEENRNRQADSRRREDILMAKQNSTTSAREVFQTLNNPKHDIFSSKYDAAAGTLHTSAYFPKEMKAWLSIGANRPPIIFDFNKWLTGENTHVSRIKGEIEYPDAFANME